MINMLQSMVLSNRKTLRGMNGSPCEGEIEYIRGVDSGQVGMEIGGIWRDEGREKRKR